MRNAWLVVQLFLRASRVQARRATLTVAAIAWGTLAFVLLLAFGEGMHRELGRAQSGIGHNLAIIWPGETGREYAGLPAGRPIRPKIDDLALLRRSLPEAAGIAGEIRTWRASFTWKNKRINARVTGTEVAYGRMRNNFARAGGRFLNAIDIERRRRVIFLGDEVAENLFGSVEPVGQTLMLDNVPYTVIGVMREKLQMGTYGGPDAGNAIIPLSTFRAQFGRERLSNVVLQAATPAEMPALKRAFQETMAARYGFDPDDEHAFGIWDTVDNARVFHNILLGLKVFLGVIGALTLLIGGVGVANIMVAVVRERTREIGVMMALGARRSSVTGPIILESLTYTFLGGLIGTSLAVLVIVGLRLLPVEGNQALAYLSRPVFSPGIALAATAVLGVIGLVSGWFPARRAASIEPAETLREE